MRLECNVEEKIKLVDHELYCHTAVNHNALHALLNLSQRLNLWLHFYLIYGSSTDTSVVPKARK